MTLRIEENYATGIPQTILPGGLRPLGIADHWTAGGTGRTGALSTIRHFQATGSTVNASYHALVFWEPPNLTCMWIVRSDRASHSLAPGLAFVHSSRTADRPREAARFTEVRRILGARAADPNAAIIALSFCGMPTDLVHALADPECLRAYRELHAQVMRGQPTLSLRPVFGHGWIQPSTRYEMDSAPGGSDLLISKMYYATPAPEDDVKINGTWVGHVSNKKTTLGVASDVREGPATSYPIVGRFGAGVVVIPTVQVKGQVIGTLVDKDRWYAGWMYATGWKFVYMPSSVLLRVDGNTGVKWTPIESTGDGHTDAELAAARADGIADAAANAAKTS